MKAIIVVALVLLGSPFACAQLPTRQGSDGVTHLGRDPDKARSPDIQDPMLLHIGMAEQWRPIAPPGIKSPAAVQFVGNRLAVAVFNSSTAHESFVGFKMVNWKSSAILEVTIDLVVRMSSPITFQSVYKGAVDLKEAGATLPFTPHLAPGEIDFYRVTPSLGGRALDAFYVEAKSNGLRFVKRPR